MSAAPLKQPGATCFRRLIRAWQIEGMSSAGGQKADSCALLAAHLGKLVLKQGSVLRAGGSLEQLLQLMGSLLEALALHAAVQRVGQQAAVHSPQSPHSQKVCHTMGHARATSRASDCVDPHILWLSWYMQEALQHSSLCHSQLLHEGNNLDRCRAPWGTHKAQTTLGDLSPPVQPLSSRPSRTLSTAMLVCAASSTRRGWPGSTDLDRMWCAMRWSMATSSLLLPVTHWRSCSAAGSPVCL